MKTLDELYDEDKKKKEIEKVIKKTGGNVQLLSNLN